MVKGELNDGGATKKRDTHPPRKAHHQRRLLERRRCCCYTLYLQWPSEHRDQWLWISKHNILIPSNNFQINFNNNYFPKTGHQPTPTRTGISNKTPSSINRQTVSFCPCILHCTFLAPAFTWINALYYCIWIGLINRRRRSEWEAVVFVVVASRNILIRTDNVMSTHRGP